MRDFHFPGRSAVYATNGMCATSHPLAAQIAVDILKRGGNAIDAAIAGAVVLGICEPQMTGIGGDCFVLFSDNDGRNIRAYNGSGRAPAAVSAEHLRAKGLSKIPPAGPEAITIPGAIEAFCTLSAQHGKLGLDAILAPAIHYAEEGVPVAPRVASDWHNDAGVLQGAARQHYLVNGDVPSVGAIFRAPGQADVLRRIAKDGARAFYEGEIAEDMQNTLAGLGGVHSLEDFASHRGNDTAPVKGSYKGVDLVEHPPNGQGATAILLLNILKQFDLASMDPLGTERAHIEAEATKLAYDARNRFIADPDHTARLAHMLDLGIAKKLAELIDPAKSMPAAAPLTEEIHRDTVYITVVDRDRMAVSLIYSIFHGFGSGIASEKYGILMQNRGAGFTLEQGHPNELGAGKRPMHTIIPAMLSRDGQVTNSFGVMGGAYQSTGHARFVTNMMDFGMDPQSAIDAARCFADADQMKVERSYSDNVHRALAQMGHNVITPDTAIGGAQSIEIRADGVLEGASDPRKDGCALGY